MKIATWIAFALPVTVARGHACVVTSLELALIPAGAALAGVALATAGNGWLDRRRDIRAARRQRDQAIAEMLTATADLMSGIQTIRAAYDRSAWRAQFRTAAAVYTAIGTALGGEESVTWNTFLDWRKSAPFLERLLAIDRVQNDQQRTIAQDLTAVLLPRTSRFFAAVALLTLGQDQKLAGAVRDLTPAMTELLELIAAKDRKYARARSDAENALGRFRDIADQRRR